MMELSVIIPTFNRGELLRGCLQSLAEQTHPASDFEVVVVVDGSTDRTREMLDALRTPFSLVVLEQPNQGQNLARNRGAAEAKGRYLLFLDDDIRAGPTLVAEHLRAQRLTGGVVGIGKIGLELPPRPDWFLRHFAEGWRGHYEELDRGGTRPTWIDCYTGNVSVERSTFFDAGGFSEDVRRGDDIELGYRLAAFGAAFQYLPDALAYQRERKGIRELASDFRSAGRAYVQLARRYPPMAPSLLGELAETNLRQTLLRYVLHLTRCPPRLLGWWGSRMRNVQRRRRWFYFLQTFFHWSGVRQAVDNREEWRRLMSGTPILMYHAFSDDDRGSRFVMPVRRFERQMKWVRRLGYRVIGLEEFLRERREHRMPAERSVVITIDDAYSDTLTRAYPVLRRHGCLATVFAVSDRIGGVNTWDDNGLRGRRLLTWSEILRLADDGIEFGAHTATHPSLPGSPEDRVREEIVGSKRRLESQLDRPIRAFAYPYGEHDELCRKVAQETGFWGACGVEPGLNTLGTPSYALRRVEIDGRLPLFRFLLALWVGDTHVRLDRHAAQPTGRLEALPDLGG